MKKIFFKSLALLYCFGTYIKQEDAQLEQIQGVTGLLGGAITSTSVALASGRQRLKHVVTDLGQEMA